MTEWNASETQRETKRHGRGGGEEGEKKTEGRDKREMREVSTAGSSHTNQ